MLSRDNKINAGLTIQTGSKRRFLKRLIKPNRDEKSVWLAVKNGGEPVSNCSVIVDSFDYYFQDEWMTAPNGYERKALMWGGRNEPIGGKVDIASKGSRQIVIAKALRIPNPNFVITYHDLSAGKTHHLLGKYKLRIKIEAITASEGSERNIEPILFDIYFDYEKTLKIKVKEIVRVALPDPAK